MKSKMEKIGVDVTSTALIHGWKYYGLRADGGCDDVIAKYNTSFTQCVTMCEHKRTTGGAQWNGMEWEASDNWCACCKNDRGHDARYPRRMHFKRE